MKKNVEKWITKEVFKKGMIVFAFCFLIIPFYAQNHVITTEVVDTNELIIVADSTAHEDYGLSYPITFIVNYSGEYNNINALVRFSSIETWDTLPEKLSTDLFNGISAVRFDKLNNVAYISTPFSNVSDSINIRLESADGDSLNISYEGVAKYYDNRVAAVTASADDWSDGFDDVFQKTAIKFRKYKIYLTVAIITGGFSKWANIQTHLDSGYIEAAAHSRTHPHTEYSDVTSQVRGCRDDIINNLDLPDQYKNGNQEYVYTWIAPFGDYTSKTANKIAESNYLIARRYYYRPGDIVEWNSNRMLFNVVYPTIEMGEFGWGPSEPGGELGYEDTSILNARFDREYENGGIYHVMCHPNVIGNIRNALDTVSYIDEHLDYINERSDVWYAGNGHIYLYQLVYQNPIYDPEFKLQYAPYNILLSRNYIKENSSIGTVIGTLAAIDPNINDTLEYSLVSGDGDDDNLSFIIDKDTIKSAEEFDYETKTEYSILVQSIDQTGLSYNRNFIIKIRNVTETSVDQLISSSPSLSIWPNPMVNEINFRLENSTKMIDKIEVINTSGSIVKAISDIRSNEYQMNRNELNSGIYLLRIDAAGSIYNLKLLVQ